MRLRETHPQTRFRRSIAMAALAGLLIIAAAACDYGKASLVAGGDTTFGAVGDVLAIPGGGQYVVDTVKCQIDKVDSAGTVTVIAGTGTCGYSGDGSAATSAQINPSQADFQSATGQLALDSTGNLYFSDSGNNRVRKVATDGTITTVAGDGSGTTMVYSFRDFTVNTCSGNSAFTGGITVVPNGTIYVACPFGIGKVNPDKTLTRVASVNPSALTSDSAGNLYYGAYYSGTIRKFDPTTSTDTQYADLNSLGLSPAGHKPIITDLTFGPGGNLYASLGPIKYEESNGPSQVPTIVQQNRAIVVRVDPGGPTRIVGTGDPDPITGPQTGYGRDLSISPGGITVNAAGSLLVTSGKSVYSIAGPDKADSGSGSNCDPTKVKPGADFTGMDFSALHIDLHRCDLSGVNFTNANITGMNLAHAYGSSINLTDVHGSSIDVTAANLSGATLTGANLTGLTGLPTLLPAGYSVRGGFLIGPQVNLSGDDFSGVDLSNTALVGANVTGTLLAGATLTNIHATYLTGTPASLPTGWAVVANTLVGPNANLTDANLDGADLSGIDLSGATLTNIHATNLTGTPTSLPTGWAIINNTLVGPGANLTGVDLTGANLTGANLTGATLNGANVTGTLFAGATLTGVQATNLTGTPASLPTGWSVVVNALVGPGANLAGVDLTGADLTAANLNGANLKGANLSNANLAGLDWTSFNLTGVTLDGANLTGTKLDGATLVGVHAANITGPPATLPFNWQVIDSTLLGQSADLSGMDLTGANLTGMNLSQANATNTNFTNANLTNVNLYGANLTGANLTGATLNNTDLRGATLTSVHAIDMNGVVLALPSGWKQCGGTLVGAGANVTGGDLHNCGLGGFDLTGTIFVNANLSGANLDGATVTNADFTGANLNHLAASYLVGVPASLPANWQLISGILIGPGANLANARLSGLELNGFDLTGANLDGAFLTSTHLAGATLTGISGRGIYGPLASLPPGWIVINSNLVGPSANLTNADLSNGDLTGIDLTGATLTGVHATNLTGAPASLPTSWADINNNLVGPSADLTGADLTGADLTGIDLTNALLDNATITGTSFSGATLTGVHATNLTGAPASLPTGWADINNSLVGPGTYLTNADLSNADLSGIDLTNASLSGTNLTGANLSGANLTNTNLYSSTLTNANLDNATVTGANLIAQDLVRVHATNLTGTPASLPYQWKLVSQTLVGAGANLTGVDLSGANLSLMTLTAVNFTNTNLTGAKLNYANLNGSTFAGTILTSATLYGVDGRNLVGTPASLPTGWKYLSNALIGLGANLSGVDLSGADLTGMNLGGNAYFITTLTGTNLTGANLTNTKFSGATGTPSGGATATYSNTTCPDATIATAPATCVGHGF